MWFGRASPSERMFVQLVALIRVGRQSCGRVICGVPGPVVQYALYGWISLRQPAHHAIVTAAARRRNSARALGGFALDGVRGDDCAWPVGVAHLGGAVMARLFGTEDDVALEDKRTHLRAPGLHGEATTGTVDLQTLTGQLLYQVIANSGLTATKDVLLTHQTRPNGSVRLTVPRPSRGRNALLLVHDADGGVSWHRPEVPTEAAHAFAVAAAGPSAGPNPGFRPGTGALPPDMSFCIPRERFAAPPAERPGGADAAIAGAAQAPEVHFNFHPDLPGLHKVLSVFEYPIEHLIGKTGSEVFCQWESYKHPYALRWFPAAQSLPSGATLTPTNWQELSEGRTLLLIHGIFSSCNGAFGSIDDATWTTLRDRYGKRIIGLDHPTACVSPTENAAWFLKQVPPAVKLDLDVVSHSRGGLVARSLAKQAEEAGPDKAAVMVKNIVFAATPNGGTEITDTKQWANLIDRITTVVTLPAQAIPGPIAAVADVLAGILEILKLLALDTALALPGLEAMCLGSPFLQTLTKLASPPNGYAIAAEFVPGNVLNTVFSEWDDIGRLVDGAIFPDIANDIAVPTNGVWDPANPTGAASPATATRPDGFPVKPENRQAIGPGDKYWHCTYFTDPEARDALLRWLNPPSVKSL
jgi:hypothetical protein